jgi:hypothetical protein
MSRENFEKAKAQILHDAQVRFEAEVEGIIVALMKIDKDDDGKRTAHINIKTGLVIVAAIFRNLADQLDRSTGNA